MTDLVDGALGQANYSVAFSGGAIVASIGDAKYGATAQVSINAKAVLEAIRAMLPATGTAEEIGNFLINIAEGAIPAV